MLAIKLQIQKVYVGQLVFNPHTVFGTVQEKSVVSVTYQQPYLPT